MGEEVGCVLESSSPVYVRPVGLATLGCNSHFAEPYRIRSPYRVHVGDGVWVEEGAHLSVVDKLKGIEYDPVLRIGDGCVIGAHLTVSCMSEVSIGSRVGIGPRVYLGDAFRDYSDIEQHPADRGYADPKPIRIHDDVIIASGVAILPGVTVGERSVVSVNSVVTRDVPPRSVVLGNPARVIRSWDEKSGKWVPGRAS